MDEKLIRKSHIFNDYNELKYFNDFSIININNNEEKKNENKNKDSFLNSCINIENNKNTFIIYDDKEDIISENEWNDIFIQHKTYSDLSKNQIYKINNSLEKGISSNIRPKIWKFLSKYESLKLNHDKNFYENFLKIKNEKIDLIIKKDIDRTYINKNKISNELKEKLFNILRVYSIYDREVGYCQGTNFIVLTLLLIIKDEIDCFWIFVVIMSGKDWRKMFVNETPKLMELMNLFLDNLKKELPNIYDLFIKKGIINDIPGIFTPYFSNIFSYNNIPIELTERIFDLFWIYEHEVIIGTIINLFKLKKDKILNFNNSDEIHFYIRNDLLKECYSDFGINNIIYKRKIVRKNIIGINEREVQL